MNYVIVAFVLILHTTLLAAEECVFDLEDQPRIINAIAKMYPGGKIEYEKRQVSWSDPIDGVTQFIYGGCQHLGSEIIYESHLPKARTQEQVFALVHKLAQRYWNNTVVFSSRTAAKALQRALEQSDYTVMKVDGKTVFSIQEEVYEQLIIEHEYNDGVDRISISWIGNF